MAGRRDEVFILGEESLDGEGFEETDAAEAEPGPAPARAPRSWVAFRRPLIAAGLLLFAAVAALSRLGGEDTPRAAPEPWSGPAPVPAPKVQAPVIHPPAAAPPPKPARDRVKRPAPASPPAPEASAPPAVTYTPAAAPAPPSLEPAPVAPAPAQPVDSVRPEFGIER